MGPHSSQPGTDGGTWTLRHSPFVIKYSIVSICLFSIWHKDRQTIYSREQFTSQKNFILMSQMSGRLVVWVSQYLNAKQTVLIRVPGLSGKYPTDFYRIVPDVYIFYRISDASVLIRHIPTSYNHHCCHTNQWLLRWNVHSTVGDYLNP